MNTPSFWMAEVEALGVNLPKEVLPGLRIAEDFQPLYRAVSLLLAQQTRLERNALLGVDLDANARDYQRGRYAMMVALHEYLVATINQAKLKD